MSTVFPTDFGFLTRISIFRQNDKYDRSGRPELKSRTRFASRGFRSNICCGFGPLQLKLAYMKDPFALSICSQFFLFILNYFSVLLDFKVGILGEIRRSFMMIRILRVLRVLRVLRILKVARYSKGFKSMGNTLKRSWRELVLLVMFMMTTNMMFSTAMYFVEVDHPKTDFHSIPEAMWWYVHFHLLLLYHSLPRKYLKILRALRQFFETSGNFCNFFSGK